MSQISPLKNLIFFFFIIQISIYCIANSSEKNHCETNSQIQYKSGLIDPDLFDALGFMVLNCPDKILTNLTKSQKERIELLDLIQANIKSYEKAIFEESTFRDVNRDWQIYKGLNQIIGYQEKDLKGIKSLVEASNNEESSRKSSCNEINNWPSHLNAPRDQSSSNWCYAYALADLISVKKNKIVSATDIALQFNSISPRRQLEKSINEFTERKTDKIIKDYQLSDQIPKSVIYETQVGYGFPAEAFQYIQKQGVCSESDLPSDNNSIDQINNYNKIQDLKNKIDLMNNRCQFGDVRVASLSFPHLSLFKTVQIMSETSQRNLIKTLADENCQGKRMALNDIQFKSYLPVASKRSDRVLAMKIIDQKLSNNQILGIGYDLKVFGENGAHASSIIGRRYNEKTKECEYALRNTWGTKNNLSSYKENKNGVYYIPKCELINSMLDIYSLE